MVTTRLYIILILCLLKLNIQLLAQGAGNIGIDLNAGTKSFPSHGRFGRGISAEYSKAFFRHGSLRAYLGYEKFDQKFPGVDRMTIEDSITKIGLRGYDLSLVPLRLGYQYQESSKLPFLYGDIGLAHVLTMYDNAKLPRNVLTYALAIAYRQKVSGNTFLQFGLSFNHYDLKQFGTRDYFSFRLAYGLTKNDSKRQKI